ncbi:MAG: PD40 domain-containing protein [Anaerolineae bacterium]|nr:PD40 domain-containing protein [Anaerolineae bacterium]
MVQSASSFDLLHHSRYSQIKMFSDFWANHLNTNGIVRNFVILCVLLILALVDIEAQEPIELQLPGQLYFYYNSQIYYVQEDSTPIPIFNKQSPILSYSWSSDGSKIAIVRNEIGVRQLAEVYNADFELLHQFELDIDFEDLHQFPVAWSSDNDALLLISTPENDLPQIVVLPLDTTVEEATIDFPLADSEEISKVYWSPDARYLLYQTSIPQGIVIATAGPETEIPQPETYDLYLFDLETQMTTFITSSSYWNCVAWSPQGNLFAGVSDYIRETETPWLLRANQLQIYDVNASIVSIINIEFEPTSALLCPLAWSNDAEQIAISYGTLSEGDPGEYSNMGADILTYQSGISAIDLASKEYHVVGVSGALSLQFIAYQAVSIEWSPDDTWIAVGALYNAFRDVRLFSYDTGEEVVITVDGQPLFDPAWRAQNE